MAEINVMETVPQTAPPLLPLQVDSVLLGLEPPEPTDIVWPPTADDLPTEDGVPMETNYHLLQMFLLIETAKLHFAGQRVFVGGNMFVYFDVAQTKGRYFRGPDFLMASGVEPHPRKSWVNWEEGKGPDLIVELISTSTADFDKGEKKNIYQNQLRVPEYYWFDPLTGELAGFALEKGLYQPLATDARGRLLSPQFNLALTTWQGEYMQAEWRWLRWETPEGVLLPTTGEHGSLRAAQLAAKLRELGVDTDALGQ